MKKNKRFYMVLLLTIGFLMLSGYVYKQHQMPPQDRVFAAIEQLDRADGYGFYSTAKRIDKQTNSETIISEIQGEKQGDHIHLKGTANLVHSKVELYQIGEDYYRQDPLTDEWILTEDYGKEAMEKLFAEINPLGLLPQKDAAEVEYLGKEKIELGKCKKYQILSYQTENFMTEAWQKILYTLWLDKKGRLRQMIIEAENSDWDQQRLELTIQFELIYNNSGNITPPINAR